MTTIQMIPLDKLYPSPANARKTGTKDGIEALAESIHVHGLLNNLVVQPGGEKGTFSVLAGGRRLAALNHLAKAKKLETDYAVPCNVIEIEGDISSEEISLAENEMRQAMHPADQFEAFRKLADEGQGPDTIAAKFGVTPRVVEQRLKLAKVSPKLIALYKKGDMTLECLMAFTISDDHKQQEKIWKLVKDCSGDAEYIAETIREQLTEQHIEASNKLAKFVSIKAYEEAGGQVMRDLFGEDGEGWLSDADLLNRLVMEKLVKQQGKLIEDGWKWCEIMPDINYSTLNKYEPLRPTRKLDEDDDETGNASFTGEQKSKSGCILSIAYNGKLEINAGLVRPEDAKAERKEATKKKAKSGKAEEPKEAGLSAKLTESLTAHRTAALGATLATKPHVALAAVVHSLALDTLYEFCQIDSCLSIKGTMTYYGGVEGIEEGRAEKMQAEATKAATKGMPKNPEKLWAWLIDKTDKELMAILAVCAACTVDAIANYWLRVFDGSAGTAMMVQK